jgi:hypothetical protein
MEVRSMVSTADARAPAYQQWTCLHIYIYTLGSHCMHGDGNIIVLARAIMHVQRRCSCHAHLLH